MLETGKMIKENASKITDWIIFNVIKKEMAKGDSISNSLLKGIIFINNFKAKEILDIEFNEMELIELRNICHENLSDYIKNYLKRENVDIDKIHFKMQFIIDERIDFLESKNNDDYLVSIERDSLYYILDENILETILF